VAANALADSLRVFRVIVNAVCFSSFVSVAHYAANTGCKRIEILFQLVSLSCFLMRIVAGNAGHHTGSGIEVRGVLKVLRLLVMLFRGLAVRPETRFSEDISGEVFTHRVGFTGCFIVWIFKNLVFAVASEVALTANIKLSFV